ncbi:MAG: hypothetical protein GY862_14105 [Gammaproteobacteria bacterium]|nr:hypothetical protein [Gammaproteobacteria bacterium]
MSTPLDKLIHTLHDAGVHPTPEELADALWLSLRAEILETEVEEKRREKTEPIETGTTQPPGQNRNSGRNPPKKNRPPEEQPLPLCVEKSPEQSETESGVTEQSEEAKEAKKTESRGAQPFRTPAPAMLPNALALGRALRPLMRKVPSRTRYMLDENATVEQIAEHHLWVPVFKGRPERWLELALIVERSASMHLWHPLVGELYTLLSGHGAFRDVRLWSLGTDDKDRAQLYRGLHGDEASPPGELTHETGRRLIWVLSDCVSPAWHQGTYDPLLRLWTASHPLALICLLPPRFWARSGLRRGERVHFRATVPGLPNAKLQVKGRKEVSALSLPITTLEPESLYTWSRLLTGHGNVHNVGVLLDKAQPLSQPSADATPAPQQRLRNFRLSASPEAQLLAGHCAAIPLTLPVMRMLQETLLSQTQQVHLAELFLSGLLLRKNRQETRPDKFFYDFHPGVRELLLDSLRSEQILTIHQRLSEVVKQHLGQSTDFLALIPDLLEEGGLRLAANSSPFAKVTITVLRRLGGKYAEAADRVGTFLAGKTGAAQPAIEPGEAMEIMDDQKRQTRRQLRIRMPVGLEKLPHPAWLCIDFGTSAIMAAIGAGNTIMPLPLQRIVSESNPYLNFIDYDPENLEKDSDLLLPSYVACDADLRTGKKMHPDIRKGFPAYQPASLKPGDPDFLSLPPHHDTIQGHSGRIIFSLKSWLTMPSYEILLGESITCQIGNKPVTRCTLQLNDTVKSGFAAFIEAYIRPPPGGSSRSHTISEAGQVVVCYPNTFSYWHQERLRHIAGDALSKYLNTTLPDEQVQLLSESDAVAYNYCLQRTVSGTHPPKLEHILVYDFGAGTVDLSLVEVRWNRHSAYPEYWQVKNTLGVSVAGNYLDSLLARLIDKSLDNPQVFDPAMFRYRYRVVSEDFVKGKEDAHRTAIRELWTAIRETKQQSTPSGIPKWGVGNNPFCIKVCSIIADDYIVSVKDELDTSRYNFEEAPQNLTPWLYENDIYLCIPAKIIHNYRPIKDFIEFVTDTLLSELLLGGGVKEDAVNTVVISGRGALWPGLHERVWNKFPNADKPDMFIKNGNAAKEAVVRGGIAWQEIQRKGIKTVPPAPPKLGIFLESSMTLIPEEEWGKGIDLTGASTFRLVQIALKEPNPAKDLTSLKKHLYALLDEIRREYFWSKNPTLFVKQIDNKGKKIIRFENVKGEGVELATVGSISHRPSKPPWPIGTFLLAPEQE